MYTQFQEFNYVFQCCTNTETMEPTEQLSVEAVEFCQQLGSPATEVSDIIGGKDKEVYRAIQEGINRVNSTATSNAQRIQKWTILRKDFSVSGGELGKFSRTSISRQCYLVNKFCFLLKTMQFGTAVNYFSLYCFLVAGPTMKLRRPVVLERYHKVIESIYQE